MFSSCAQWTQATDGSSLRCLRHHPSDDAPVRKHADQNLAEAILYFMCDDLPATMKSMESKKVSCTPVVKAEWGITTTVRLPSGAALGLYQPTHPSAI